ncbi:hypothetical protein D3C87_115070 [compost metagenome]
MKRILIKYLGCALVTALFLASCKKETTNIFNMFEDVKVTFHSNSPYAVTDYKLVNVDDSVYIEYTIESAKKGMFAVCIFETSSALPTKIFLNSSQRKSYSGIVKLKMNTRVGKISYRIWALDSAGVYLGDGYKMITLEVKSDYNYYAGREVFSPDTLEKVNPCYLSLNSGERFSYSNGAANSAKIDLGLYRVPVINPTTQKLATYKYDFYTLNANPLPFTAYDMSSWTKRATLISAPKTGQSNTWLNSLRTGTQIGTLGKSAKPNLKATTTGLSAGSLFYFLTPEGKYGAVYVNSVEINNLKSGVFINVDIKVQK